jgi:hypothetical protein
MFHDCITVEAGSFESVAERKDSELQLEGTLSHLPRMQPPSNGGVPRLLAQQVDNCRFSSWYPNFQAITIPSKVIPLPEDVVEYLFADQIFLPGRYTSISLFFLSLLGGRKCSNLVFLGYLVTASGTSLDAGGWHFRCSQISKTEWNVCAAGSSLPASQR